MYRVVQTLVSKVSVNPAHVTATVARREGSNWRCETHRNLESKLLKDSVVAQQTSQTQRRRCSSLAVKIAENDERRNGIGQGLKVWSSAYSADKSTETEKVMLKNYGPLCLD